MTALITESKKILFIPEDRSCAVLYVPPAPTEEGGGHFLNARLAKLPEDETAVLIPDEKAKEFLWRQVNALADGWGDVPLPSATQDDLIKWVDACINPPKT